MRGKLPSLSICMVLVFAILASVDMGVEISSRVRAATIYVGGTGPGNYSTIQEGVDAANLGDTVFVYSGLYAEQVYLNYSISLIGNLGTSIGGGVTIQSPLCLVKGFNISTMSVGIIVEDDYSTILENNIGGDGSTVGISVHEGYGHLIKDNYIFNHDWGMDIYTVNNSVIRNNKITFCKQGIYIDTMNFNDDHFLTIENNYISNCTGINGHDIEIRTTNNILFSNNTFAGNGIMVESASGMEFVNNSFFNCGIMFNGGPTINNDIVNNNFTSNGTGFAVYCVDVCLFNMSDSIISNYEIGVDVYGGRPETMVLSNCTFIDNIEAISAHWVNLSIVNSSIINSSQYDFHIYSWDFDNVVTSLNTTFDKSKVIVEEFLGLKITFEVKWFLHVNVTNPLGDPIVNANVRVEDNENGTFNETWQTGSDGFARWIITTEYTQNLTSLTFYTPHDVTAWKGTAYGHANIQMDKSKTINVILDELPCLNMKCGWSPVSFKVIPSEIDLDAVLQSIKGKYDWVQVYDSSDPNDPWKHYHAQKPAHLNDLKTLDHTMGFYLHINDTEGAILTVNGSEPSSPQYIDLYKGWNFVGYPSLSDKNRTAALNNLTFNTHVDAIMTYNTTTQKWENVGGSDYLEVGRGYYIHAITDCQWEVPL